MRRVGHDVFCWWQEFELKHCLNCVQAGCCSQFSSFPRLLATNTFFRGGAGESATDHNSKQKYQQALLSATAPHLPHLPHLLAFLHSKPFNSYFTLTKLISNTDLSTSIAKINSFPWERIHKSTIFSATTHIAPTYPTTSNFPCYSSSKSCF